MILGLLTFVNLCLCPWSCKAAQILLRGNASGAYPFQNLWPYRPYRFYPPYRAYRPYQAVNNYNWGTQAMHMKLVSDGVSRGRAESVKEAIRHFWYGYKLRAFGGDEIGPLSGSNNSQAWGGMGMCMLDTLDTLWIAGLRDEFEEGVQWLPSLQFEHKPMAELFSRSRKRNYANPVSFFETTIRALGGLLSSYALSQEPIFLEKARDLGNRLLGAFPRPGSGLIWPEKSVDIANPMEYQYGQIGNLAEIGTNVLEFTYLSEATGNSFYKGAADSVMNHIMDVSQTKGTFLAPKEMSSNSMAFGTNIVSLGGGADSYFEYLLKMYLQSGKKERRPLLVWKAAMEEMKNGAIKKSPDGFLYIASEVWRGFPSKASSGGWKDVYSSHTMEHLACFVGGMLALGAHLVPPEDKEEWWLPYGAELTRTCYEMYHQNPSGLGVEKVTFQSGRMQPAIREFHLRPETLESLFYLYRVTGDEKYRDWSWNIMTAINKHLRTLWGYAAAADVTTIPVPLTDSEETFMGAETLKYAYLIHMPKTLLPLEQFVLNTEAHPLPVKSF